MSKRKKSIKLKFRQDINLENTFWAANPDIDTPKQFKDFSDSEKVALYYMNPKQAQNYFSNTEVMKDYKQSIKLPKKPVINESENDNKQQKALQKTTPQKGAENAAE